MRVAHPPPKSDGRHFAAPRLGMPRVVAPVRQPAQDCGGRLIPLLPLVLLPRGNGIRYSGEVQAGEWGMRTTWWVLGVCLALVLGACPEQIASSSPPGSIDVGQVCADSWECVENSVCINQICRDLEVESPTARAGGTRITLIGLPATLDGSQSEVPDAASDVSYVWTIVSAPAGSAAVLANSDTSQPTLTGDFEGVFEVQLKLTADGLSSIDTASVVVLGPEGELPKAALGEPCLDHFQCASGECADATCQQNFAPVATAGTIRFVAPGELVALDAAGSSDPDGDELSYQWQIIQTPDGSTSTLDAPETVAPSFIADLDGAYVIRLVVNDGWLPSSPIHVAIVADFALGEKRPDGAACDNEGMCASQTCEDGKCAANLVPIADAGPLQYVDVLDVVTLDASQSFDPEGEDLTYAWTVFHAPDGSVFHPDAATSFLSSDIAMTPDFAPDLPGIYVFRLQVNDGVWPSLAAVCTVAVGLEVPLLPIGSGCSEHLECESLSCSNQVCSQNTTPIADAGPLQFVDLGTSVVVDGTGSLDPDGDPLTYAWTLEPPDGSSAALNDPTLDAPSFSTDVVGIYRLTLEVSDGGLLPSAVATTTVIAGIATGFLGEGSTCDTDAECLSANCDATLCAANEPPVAVASGPVEVDLGTDVLLDGTASTDAEGATLSYQWTIALAPPGSTATLSSAQATSATPAVTPTHPGDYGFALVVHDGHGPSTPALVVVTVDPATGNVPPSAHAGADQTVLIGATVQLDGSLSSDSDGTISEYRWSLFTPTVSSATLSAPATVNPTFPADVAGAFIGQLEVFDGEFWSPVDVVSITVLAVGGTNLPPTAALATEGTYISVGSPASLDASASSDPESGALTYEWTLTRPPGSVAVVDTSGNEATPTLNPDYPGVYMVSLRVQDPQGAFSDAVSVVLAAGIDEPQNPNGFYCDEDLDCTSLTCVSNSCVANEAPTARAGDDVYADVSDPVVVDGTGSTDPEGQPLNYTWTLIHSPEASVANVLDEPLTGTPTLTPDVVGQYVMQLVVDDSKHVSTPDTVVVTVGTGEPQAPDGASCKSDPGCQSLTCINDICVANAAPVAVAGADIIASLGTTVQTDSSASSDPEGAALTPLWSFATRPDGSNASLTLTGGDPTFVPDVPGTYVLELVVTDGKFLSEADFTQIIAGIPQQDGGECSLDAHCISQSCVAGTCATNLPPIAVPGPHQEVAVGMLVALDGNGSSDPEGEILSFAWSLVSPSGSAATLAAPTAASAMVTPDLPGTYLVTLVVNDGVQESTAVSTLITAYASGDTPDGADCGNNVDCLSGKCVGDTCQPNQAPIAVASPAQQSVTPGTLVTLDGSGSTDPDSDPIASHLWVLLDGPSGNGATVDDPASAVTTITPSVEGVYLFGLTVNDGYLDSPVAFATVGVSTTGLLANGEPCGNDNECISQSCSGSVCTANDPPSADAGPHQVIVVGNVAGFDGSGSSDPESGTVTYLWTLVAPSGSSSAIVGATTATPSLTPDVPGPYLLTLVVNDGTQNSAPDTTLVTAFASGSVPDGNGCSINSDCASGHCSGGICAANQAPVASATPAQQSVSPGTLVSLSGTSSSDPDGDDVTFQWVLVDAPAGNAVGLDSFTGSTTSITPTLEGVYLFGLTANDGYLDSPIAYATVGVSTTGLLANGEACVSDGQCISQSCIGNICTANAPPVADPGPAQVTVIGVPVTLDGTGSSDPEGTGLTYSWTMVSPATSTAVLTGATTDTGNFIPDRDGAYLVTLVVNDGAQNSVPQTILVRVYLPGEVPDASTCSSNVDCVSGKCTGGFCAANQAPVARPTPVQQSVTPGTLVNLSGTTSSDPNSDPIVSYVWVLVDAPVGNTATLSSASASTPSITPTVEGIYLFGLTVSDSYLNSPVAYATVGVSTTGLLANGEPCSGDGECISQSCVGDICVANDPPIADPGLSQVTLVGDAVVLDGSGSSDPESAGLTYAWTLTRPAASSATLSGVTAVNAGLTPDVPGAYLVRLTVNDGTQNSLTETILVDAYLPGQVPDGSTCGSNSDCASGKCTGGFCGTNQAPVASATPLQQSVTPGTLVNLSGTASSDPDGDTITSYLWVLVDAPVGNGATLDSTTASTTSITPTVEGVYLFGLTVSDSYLDAPVAYATVGVSTTGLLADGESCAGDAQCLSLTCATTCQPNLPPVAVAGPPIDDDVGLTHVLDGTASLDPEAQPLSYSWAVTTFPTGGTWLLTGETTATPNFRPDVEGIYVLTLLVDDGKFSSLPTAQVVTAGNPDPLPGGAPCGSGAECGSLTCTAGVCTPNSPPIADAGAGQAVDVGADVMVRGVLSVDPEGWPLTYYWTLTTPPGSSATLDDPYAVSPNFIADVPGIYTADLVVDDGNDTDGSTTLVFASDLASGASGTPCFNNDDCASGWCVGTCQPNIRPDALITGTPTARVGETVLVKGGASSDPDSYPLPMTFEWYIVSSPVPTALNDPTAVQPTFEPTAAGDYVFMLRVFDGALWSIPATHKVTVAANTAPQAVINTELPMLFVPGATVLLDAVPSVDPEGDPLTYTWVLTKPNGSTASLTTSGTTAQFDVDLEGTYTATVTVSDGALSDEATSIVPFIIGDKPVAVVFGPSNPAGRTCIFSLDGTQSFDTNVGGTVANYLWTTESLPVGSTAVLETSPMADRPTMIPDFPGVYQFGLVVVDNDGALSDKSYVTVLVEDPELILDLNEQLKNGNFEYWIGEDGYDVVRYEDGPGGNLRVKQTSFDWATELMPTPFDSLPTPGMVDSDVVSWSMNYGVLSYGQAGTSSAFLKPPQCLFEEPTIQNVDLGGGITATLTTQLTAEIGLTTPERDYPGARHLVGSMITSDGSVSSIDVWYDANLGAVQDKGRFLVFQSATPGEGWVPPEPKLSVPGVPPGSIVVDGSDDDWSGLLPLWADLIGDAGVAPAVDLKSVYFADDGAFVYGRVTVVGALTIDDSVQVHIASDPLNAPSANDWIFVVAYEPAAGDWRATLCQHSDPMTCLPNSHPVAMLSDGFEFSINMDLNYGGASFAETFAGGFVSARACNTEVGCSDAIAPTVAIQTP